MKLGLQKLGRVGSILIIVLWIALGLVSVALYFANAMVFEHRASDNRVAGSEAEQAIEGAARYVSYLLANQETPGQMPDIQSYPSEAVAVGDASFWLIGRHDLQTTLGAPYFSLLDESSKLNLNRATQPMLEALPRMTPEFAASIIDWRDTNSDLTMGGAESEAYSQRNPSYACKNAPFETVEELKLVSGATMEILYGEDTNLNGALDANENDGDTTQPNDNRDGKLDAGILSYLTVFSRGSNTRTNGSPRVNVSNQQQMRTLLQEKIGPTGLTYVTRAGAVRSPLEFYMKSRMTAEEFAQIENDIVGSNVEGLVNVNTASEVVLACIPGILLDKAPAMVAYRQSNPDKLNSLAWVKEVLDETSATQAGEFLTGSTHTVSADIAALGHYGRGYRRTRFVFDTTEEKPKIIFRQDLGHLGWSLGRETREQIQLANQLRK